MPENFKKPKCKLIGEDGNIYNLAGLACIALKEAGYYDKVEEMTQRIYKSKSYYEALCVIMDYVEVY